MTTTPSQVTPTNPAPAEARRGEPAAPAIAITDPSRFLNRELQWLEFNDRVLQQAVDERMPLLERVRFLSIFGSNLDEFFMKRVGGLRRQIAMGVSTTTYDGISAATQLEMIRQRVIPMIRRIADAFRNQIQPKLREAGLHLLSYSELEEDERRRVDAWYRTNVFPVLTPLAVDPGHRFPFISNLSVSLGVMLRRPGAADPRTASHDGEQLFARVKVPEVIPRWHRIGKEMRFVWLPDVIENNLDDLFPGMEIMKVLPFRVTRNADVEREYEDAEDLLEEIQQELRERRFAPVVRLQVARGADRRLLRFLTEQMELKPDDIYETDGLIEYRSLSEIADLDLPQHRFPSWNPVISPRLMDDEKDIFSVIRDGDLLVHHPYESFHASVERFIKDAVADRNVLCIKQALYRTSGDSVFVPELIRAAEAGKQVAVLVEVRARFDEERNITWARKLEDAGVHVAYGVVGLKTHTKIALVVRREKSASGGELIRSYAHISTGNYNSKTARLYEDLGLFTSDPAIIEDIVELFNYLTGRSRQQDYNKLLVAPVGMKRQYLERIEREIALQRNGGRGRIIAKMNQLQDQDVIDALYRASQAGVGIDLIVRGFCTLRPGVPGLSENIRVTSIVGRFLEHSRIYYFGAGQDDPLDGEYFIGSADWMYRNLHARVEAATPVEHRALRKRLWQVLELCLSDRRQCWEMQPDGSYRQRSPEGLPTDSPAAIGTQQALMTAAIQSVREREAGE